MTGTDYQQQISIIIINRKTKNKLLAMGQDEIINDNKLIATFMDGKYDDVSKSWTNLPLKLFEAMEIQWAYSSYDIRYHQSWDWLMPVVAKANKICNERGQELSNRSREQGHLSNPLDNPLHWKSWSYHYIGLSTDISMVYKKTVDFIKWYEQNERKQ